jgi:tetratricopeptide (TPR) repeat protein
MSKNDDENQGLEGLDYLGYLEEGQRYQKQGALKLGEESLKLAEECFSNAIKLDSSNIRAYLQRGYLYQEQREFDQALTDFNQAINCNPNNSVAYLKRGDVYQTQGKLELALKDYNYVIDNFVFPNISNNVLAEFLLSRGRVYQKQKRFDLALKDFTQAIKFKKELKTDSSEAYRCRGILYQEMGNFQEALKNVEQAITHANNPAELKKSILIEMHSYYITANDFYLARKCIEIAFTRCGGSQIEIQNRERYLNHIETYEENIQLKNRMQKVVQQYTHALGNNIFPESLSKVARKLKGYSEFQEESLLLYKVCDAEVFIIHQSELLRHKYIAQNPGQFRDLICEDILLSDNNLETATNIERILNDALKRVTELFLDDNYAKLNRVRKQVLAQHSLYLPKLRQHFESQIFFENQSSLNWVHANLFTITTDFSKNWKSVKLKKNGFAEALLQGYFYELFFNIFKYSDYQGIELQFDEQEIDGCPYLISRWKNSYMDNTRIGTGNGLNYIREDLCLLHDSENEATTLQRSDNLSQKNFQVTLPLRKNLLISYVIKEFPIIQ